MEDLLTTPIDNKKSKKVIMITMGLFCLLPMLLDYFVLVPIYSYISTDIAHTVTSVILYYVLQVLWLIAFAVPYALIIFSILLISRKRARGIVIFYAIVYFCSIPCRYLMTAVIAGTLGTLNNIMWDAITMSVFFAFSMIQLFVVYFFAATDSKRYFKYLDSLKLKKKKKAQSEIKSVLPIEKFFNLKNPLQRSAFKMSVFIGCIKILTRVISDIVTPAPSTFVEVLVIIAYYLFDLLYGVLAYVIALLVFTVVYDKLKVKEEIAEDTSSKANKKEADEDNAPSAKEVE